MAGWIEKHVPVWAPPAVVAAVLGFVGISDWSLWMDEAATLGMAERSLREVLQAVSNEDLFSGAYYVLMSVWVDIAGTSELALRAPSALGIVVAAGCTAAFAKRLFSWPVGLVAGLLLAVTPRITSVHARDARQYGLVLGAAGASALLLVLVTERTSRRREVAYGASVAAMGLLHVLALPVLVGHGVLVHLRGGRVALRRWLLVAGLGALPAVLVFVYSRIWGTSPTSGVEPDVRRLLATPAELLGDAGYGWFLVGLAVAALARTAERVFLAVWIAVPVVVLYLASHLVTPSWVPRYLLVVAPALVVLAARSLTTNRIAAVAGAVLVVGLVWHPTEYLRAFTSQLEDYRAAAAHIEDGVEDGDAIVYDHPAHRQGVEYYWGDDLDDPPEDVLVDVPAEDRARLFPSEVYPPEDASLDGVDRVWLVGSSNRGPELTGWLASEGFEVVEQFDAQFLPVLLLRRT